MFEVTPHPRDVGPAAYFRRLADARAYQARQHMLTGVSHIVRRVTP